MRENNRTNNKLFLTGNIRTGKSTLVREAIRQFRGKIQGISCQRLVIDAAQASSERLPHSDPSPPSRTVSCPPLETAPLQADSTQATGTISTGQSPENSSICSALPEYWKVVAYRLTDYRDDAPLTVLYKEDDEEDENIFLRFNPEGGPPKWNSTPFVEKGRRILEEILSIQSDCNLALLDEIGGREVNIPEFMKELDALLRSDMPCIGVVKERDGFHRVLQEEYGIEVLELTENNETLVRGQLRKFLAALNSDLNSDFSQSR